MLRESTDRLNTVLVVLISAALALGILTYFVIFLPSSSYLPVIIKPDQGTTSFGTFATSTPTSSLGFSSTSIASSVFPGGVPIASGTSTPSNPTGTYSSEYTAPYPVSWSEGNEQFSVIGASLQGNQFTLNLAIQMGNLPECVPLNVRLIADEMGTMKTPDSPPNTAFVFPDTQNCDGTPGATYSEPLIFTVDPLAPSYLFTTGGASNIYFTAATSTGNSIDVSLPSHSG